MKEHAKYLIYTDGNGKIRDSRICYESGTPKGNLNKWKLFYYILFERGFLWKLTETIKYALTHYDCYKGACASDVLMFENTKGFDKIWEKQRKIKL